MNIIIGFILYAVIGGVIGYWFGDEYFGFIGTAICVVIGITIGALAGTAIGILLGEAIGIIINVISTQLHI